MTSITPEEAFEMGRTDKAVVLKQIYEDYDYAAENLPAANNNSGATRVDKGTAYAYKARTALYQHDYGTAANAAQDCMDLEVYDLAPDYGELFRDKTRGSKEVIFSVAHSSDLELDETVNLLHRLSVPLLPVRQAVHIMHNLRGNFLLSTK